MTIIVDAEFERLCPPLTPEEYAGLEESIRAEGCRDALVVWEGENILLDGHNRYAICERLGVPYRTVGIVLPDRDAAIAWIITNQLSRRNLHPDAASILRGRLYNMRKKAQGAPIGNDNRAIQSGKSCHFDKTSEQLAKELGVSERTVRNDGAFAQAVETLTPFVPSLLQKAMAGEAGARKDVIEAAKDPEHAAEHMAHVGHNSGNNEWYTPAEYVDAARAVLGDIDLDPASSEAANTVIRAKRFYSAGDSGLPAEWHGRIWMNPPFAQPLIVWFCDKMVAEYKAGHIEAAIVLVNNATETRWFQDIADICSAICFPRGRIKFWAPDKDTAAPLQGQALLYIGEDLNLFRERFGRFGMIFTR